MQIFLDKDFPETVLPNGNDTGHILSPISDDV